MVVGRKWTQVTFARRIYDVLGANHSNMDRAGAPRAFQILVVGVSTLGLFLYGFVV